MPDDEYRAMSGIGDKPRHRPPEPVDHPALAARPDHDEVDLMSIGASDNRMGDRGRAGGLTFHLVNSHPPGAAPRLIEISSYVVIRPQIDRSTPRAWSNCGIDHLEHQFRR